MNGGSITPCNFVKDPTCVTMAIVKTNFPKNLPKLANFELLVIGYRVIPCQLIHFFADPSPILMKFGKLGGQQKKLIHTKFQHISTIFNGVRAL